MATSQFLVRNRHNTEGESVGVVFQTATPFDTPCLMDELIAWTNTSLNEKSLHPLLIISIFTVVFLEIHPFQDGNGRLSRRLTTLLLLKSGYAYVPYSSMESVSFWVICQNCLCKF